MNKQVFLGNWADVNDVIRDFGISLEAVDGCNFITASYYDECYEGNAYVLFEKNGMLYEVCGIHCSCHGLENQWEPQETSRESLRHILKNGNYFGNYHNPSEVGGVIREWLEADQQ